MGATFHRPLATCSHGAWGRTHWDRRHRAGRPSWAHVSVLANAVVVTVGRHDVIAIAPYAVPVAVAVGTAVVIGAVVYKVSRIQFGRTRTLMMIAYLPRPGSVQASPIAGGTTLTTPGQVQITLPTYHAATGVAGEIESLDGKSRSEADALLCSRGATRSVTAGGYTHYKFPDKSQVVIGPDGRVIRTPAPEYGPNGERTNKGHRLDQNGQPTTSHDTGERLRD